MIPSFDNKKYIIFQIKKCSLEDIDSCGYCMLSLPRLPEELYKDLHFLPDPVIDSVSGDYKTFESVYGNPTDDSARPGLKYKPEATERDKAHKSILTAGKYLNKSHKNNEVK